jgi:cell wall-associated NlpC family hydrolase
LVLPVLSACASWPEGEGDASHDRPVGSAWLSWPDGPEASAPANDVGVASPVISAAKGVLGAPYRWGGNDPAGFDCSGLIYYAHRQAGHNGVPRTTREQYRKSRPVSRQEMRAGDLVFFAIDGLRVTHVGLYAGNGRFIHSPSPGSRVSWASLEDGYWSGRFAGAGRLP